MESSEKPRQTDEKLRYGNSPATAPANEAGPASRVDTLVQYDDDTSPPEVWVAVRVYSIRKPNLYREGRIDLPKTPQEISRMVQIVAGAIAEELDGQYGDRHDPAEVARLAQEGLTDCIKQIRGEKKTFSHGGA
jgi:hypothetical protein